MDKTERDSLIIRMAASGSNASQISMATGLSYNGVRGVLRRNQAFITDRLPPPGMSIRTAQLLLTTIGLWPDEVHAPKIAERRMDFKRGGGTGWRDWDDLDAWLIGMGYAPPPTEKDKPVTAGTSTKLLSENTVCEAVFGWLSEKGFDGKWIPAGRKGFDIDATHRQTGQRWIIEAKGETSSNPRSKAYGKSSGQNGAYGSVAQAFWMATHWACKPEMLGINLAIAIPATDHFDKHSKPIEPACRLLGIAIFRVAPDLKVTIFPSQAERLASNRHSRPADLMLPIN